MTQPAPDQRLPRLPLGPRGAYSKRTRTIMAVSLAVGVALAVGLGAKIAGNNASAPPRSVTIPLADRSASTSLLRQAERVSFEPPTAPGVGKIEGRPAVTTTPSAKDLLQPGTVAPAFTLRTPTGQKVSLADFRGKTVLLEFFATWCPHCAAEAPHMKKLYGSLPHSRYAFVDVNGDSETAPSILAWHIYFGLPFPALLDPGGKQGSFHAPGSRGTISTAYRIPEFPTFYVIDPAGRIAWAAWGEQPDELLLRELRAATPAA